MTKTLNWGILGASHFAKNFILPAIMVSKGNTVAALATSDPEKAVPFQLVQPSLRIHTDYDALLADDGIDAVYIPLPNTLHVEWTKKAIAAGKHVLTEKPIAMRAAEIDDLITLRDASSLLVAEAYMIVHHPQWHYAKELYDSGVIGTLWTVDSVFSYNNVADRGNIRNRPETGGGSLPDIGVYTFGSARYVTGEEPTEILSADIKWENNVDVWSHIRASFPSFRFSSTTSMRLAPRQEVTFHGDRGYIKLTTPFNAQVFSQAEVTLWRDDMTTETKRFPADNHYVFQFENFRNSVLTGAPYPCPLEFSQGTQRMIDMSFAKAASG